MNLDISKYFVLAALLCAALSIGLIIFIVIQRKIYSDQLDEVNIKGETLSEEMFDWKADEFERTFKFRFVIPSIVTSVLCILSVALSVASLVLKYCALR